eukprot:4727479-Amphidinium_carterae.1
MSPAMWYSNASTATICVAMMVLFLGGKQHENPQTETSTVENKTRIILGFACYLYHMCMCSSGFWQVAQSRQSWGRSVREPRGDDSSSAIIQCSFKLVVVA